MDTISIIAVLGSLFLLLFVLIYAYYLNKKERFVSTEEKDLYRKSDEVMEQAVHKAQRVLKDAIEKAKRMLAQTDYFQREIERESRNTLLQTSHRYIEIFDKNLKSLSDSYKDLFVKIEDQAVSEIKKAVEDQKLSSQLYLQKRIDEEYEHAKKEIQGYKQAELDKASHSVEQIVQRAARDVLQRSISASDQKELIIKALEKAKAEGIFEG